MHSAKFFVLAIAAATAAANSVTTILDASTAQHVSIGTESVLSSAEDVTVPVVSASVTQSSRTDVDTATTEASSADVSASTTGVTRPSSFPNATTTLASSVVPTKSQNTTTPTSHVTGGAIPQQMQSSMAGLIGFCIMGLIML
ncbi:uncharacterized protein TRIVIDRAFT_232617 [Trichoderma virens Gv29-8]|uniref:GPI anchored protein n=1 Tax=Hypocrea virens (strain Gv29-8 / FGSC 10586) TaxID=413071 RepID=G9NCQ6_HYPVG|nr:uncharacterized protein TRIVIDRAFT_232617 [Trichoderma virens Gv29-8]EHK15478.1 hypothetical protein TRIVIDRAFT_232617 [Trichoderma virens Gv29-8]UKZ51424.1 hypothetical protein TrVGV298_005184 [Trichoderma virens]UKZ77246.1 hypothetical protein TrVFT333_004966 [Trichoderma virens FT-333]